MSAASMYWVRVTIVYGLHAFVLLLCGRDVWWWQGWAVALLFVSVGIASRWWAERRHPGLMAERAQPLKGPGVKPWDKILAPLMALSLGLPLFIVAGLDHRFGWSPDFPVWSNVTGLLLVAAGYAFGSWALAENQFFSAVVRIQGERGHVVCDTGPYRIVRHPGYAGNTIPPFAMAGALGSVWVLIPALVALVVTVIRTALEDRTLQDELAGYDQYAKRVRYRLWPGVY
jgi:protein-S-isoprenylcysteine O-methyltransferase Ste14